jgi:hypothetical protein
MVSRVSSELTVFHASHCVSLPAAEGDTALRGVRGDDLAGGRQDACTTTINKAS